MHIEVEESVITWSATTGEAAASAVATIELDAVATSVALAMPGSRAAGEAAGAAAALAETAQVLAAGLAELAKALRAAVSCYATSEDHVVAQGRQTAGPA